MLVDGRKIAQELKDSLKQKVSQLIQKGVTPHLAVILQGEDPGSAAYVKAKKKAGDEIGIKVTIYSHQITPDVKMINDSNHLSFDKKQLVGLVRTLNNDLSVHGIIIQRPLPIAITKEELDLLVQPEKDVDGFHPNTKFDPPIALAVDKILQWVAHDICNNPQSPLKQPYCEPYLQWLKEQRVLVIGRGETAGKPIAGYLTKKGAQISIAHSKTENFDQLCRDASIIISCVGKSKIVRHSMVRRNTILIGVGLHSKEGKLRTDYDLEEVKEEVAYYTPVPGGVGPVNVVCLMENVVQSASK